MPKWLSGILLVLFVLFPKEVKEGVKGGLDNSFLVLVPSLFPYMIMSQCFILTGGAEAVSRFLPISFFTGFSKKGAEIYFLSLFCGYPTGARLASISYDKGEINKNEKLKLFAAANIPGFGFSIAFLGSYIFKNSWLGIKIYISFVLASVFIAFFLDFFLPCEESEIEKQSEMSFQGALVKSILDSSQSIITIIAFVCFFSSLIKIFSVFIKNELLLAVFSVFLEITNGIPMLMSRIQPPEAAIVFFTAFSGLSIIFQSVSFQKKQDINIFLFLILRVAFGITAMLLFWLFTG